MNVTLSAVPVQLRPRRMPSRSGKPPWEPLADSYALCCGCHRILVRVSVPQTLHDLGLLYREGPDARHAKWPWIPNWVRETQLRPNAISAVGRRLTLLPEQHEHVQARGDGLIFTCDRCGRRIVRRTDRLANVIVATTVRQPRGKKVCRIDLTDC